ncbi:MAG: glycosyltransferase family 4 protein, partial [Vicinamibacteria bacterium]
MHLLYLSYPGGGLETNVRVLAPALEAAGHRVSILSTDSRASSVTPNPESRRSYSYRSRNVHHYFHRATFGLGSLSRVVRSFEETRAIARRVRSIHERDPVDLIELPEIFASSRLFPGMPFVIRLHGSAWTFRAQIDGRSGMADGLERRMEARTLRAASGISSPSRALAEYISRTCGIESERIVTILYPIDTTKFTPDDRQREPLVLFVGRVERRKGAHLLLQAVADVRRHHPSCQFAFVGRVCEDMQEDARS